MYDSPSPSLVIAKRNLRSANVDSFHWVANATLSLICLMVFAESGPSKQSAERAGPAATAKVSKLAKNVRLSFIVFPYNSSLRLTYLDQSNIHSLPAGRLMAVNGQNDLRARLELHPGGGAYVHRIVGIHKARLARGEHAIDVDFDVFVVIDEKLQA